MIHVRGAVAEQVHLQHTHGAGLSPGGEDGRLRGIGSGFQFASTENRTHAP
jgi:hypothetical protein